MLSPRICFTPLSSTSRLLFRVGGYSLTALLLLPLSNGVVAQAQTGDKRQSTVLEEVLVTAQRREQNAQEVPISMTVLDQQQINNSNIVNAGDLATFTPSLQSNNRFGADATTFQIRGFTQELRTTSSVGVYFAEVIAPRGANTSSSGDGAGPGDFFDLANVQVLKGPQGTLFGRNTTGGSVLLTPQKPTDELEGYLELSAGNYDMERAQVVVNVPVNERIRFRVGVDDQRREGHLNNVSGIGPDDLADVNYTALRASLIVDINETLDNYTIFKKVDSKNDNTVGSIFICNPSGSFGSFCTADLARREAAGKNDFYDVWNNMEEPVSEMHRQQLINTTTWEINENLTFKNIVSYAEFEFYLEGMVYGTNWTIPTGGGSRELIFAMAGLAEDERQAYSKTWVEEIQFQGTAMEDRLNWQAGLYFEETKPKDEYGSQSPALIGCDRSTIRDPNPANWRCNDLLGAAGSSSFRSGSLGTGGTVNSPAGPVPANFVYVGSIVSSPGGVEYESKAIYAQGSYDFSEHWRVTAGLRYTADDTRGEVTETVAKFPGDLATGAYYAPDSIVVSRRTPEVSSEEPTWLLGLDWLPDENTMYYAKYIRGYRQGSVNLAGSPPFDTHDPEKVDTIEIGAKTQFESPVPTTFNISLFYNDFQDQQVQYGYRASNGTGTTAILNAGSSTIQGAELEANFELLEGLRLMLAYTYLDTEVDKLELPSIPPSVGTSVSTSTAEGEPLPYAPENQVVASLGYTLPLDEKYGPVSAAMTYVYNDEREAVAKASSPVVGTLDAYEIFNFNLAWQNVMGSQFDATAFVTNAFDEEYITFLTGNWSSGLEAGQVGLPRMYGLRVKYSF